MLQRYILFWLVASSAIAFAWPQFGLLFNPFPAAASGLNTLIIITMFAVGALLPVHEVNQVFQKWPSVLAGTAIQYVSMPMLAWSVVSLLKPAPETAAGIIIVGCVPGAMASNVLTLAAKGNVSYSVSLTTAATLLSPLVVPLTLWLTMDSRIEYDGWATVKLMLLQVVLPVVIGHLLSRNFHWFDDLATRYGSTIANLSILVIIATVVATKRTELTQASIYLLLALGIINAGGYLAGYFCGAALKFPEGKRRALTLEVGMQNAGAGVVLATKLFGSDSIAVVPCAIYTIGCMITGTILAAIWQGRSPTP